MQNSDFRTRITSLSGSLPWSVVFCLQNCDFRTRMTSLYWSQPLSVIFARKTATFGTDLQVSMVPRPNLCFCVCKRACLASELLVSMGPSPHLWFCAFKIDFITRFTSLYGSQPSSVVLCIQIANLAPDLQVSMRPRPRLGICECKTACLVQEWQVNMGSSPHLWIWHSKQCAYHQTYKSLLVPHLACGFMHAKQRS